jgi:alanine racemase
VINPLRIILNRKSFPLNRILISRSSLLHNYQYLSSINPQIKIAPVLKSNAYGHGLNLLGDLLDAEGAPFLCVDSLLEAHQLKKVGIKTPILIMGYVDPKSLRRKKLPFSFTVYDLNLARIINEFQKGVEVHIFVDTGMHREGVLLEDLPKFIRSLKLLRSLNVVGLMTHLAIGGEPNNSLTLRQLKEFKEAIKICEDEGLQLKWRHIGGSNAVLHNDLDSCGANVVRSGLAIYGIDPIFKDEKLKPSLLLTSKISQVKDLKKGESTGYDATFLASKKMKIAILPIGYNDGVDRRLSNRGCVLVKGVKCQIIGMISMNITTIDVSEVKNPRAGNEVEVFSATPNEPNSFQEASKQANTTVYDLLVHLNPYIRRETI